MTNTVTFHRGDIRDIQAAMPASSVDLIVTSPPFLALRSYLPADHPDKHREIGSEGTPAAFLDTMLELTAEWRRLVTATGSIAVEIGDTYSGSALGFQPGHATEGYGTTGRQRAEQSNRPDKIGPGWPLAKSLCGIPTLYAWSLAYGRNLLTGGDSPAGRLRVRNLLTWTRPNPPVGALGDKYRPATSFVTVACTSDKRWFDLDAVRQPLTSWRADTPDGRSEGERSGRIRMTDTGGSRHDDGQAVAGGCNPAGAPPLDWWDHDPDWQPLHRLPTAPFKGWTETVRQVHVPTDADADGSQRTTSPNCPLHGSPHHPDPNAADDEHGDDSSTRTEHSNSRPAPTHGDGYPSTSSNNGPTETAADPDDPAATRRNRPSSRTGHAPSTNPTDTPSDQTLPRIDGRRDAPSSAPPHHDTPSSSTSSDGSDANPTPQSHGRIADTDTEQSCTCSFYRIESITERTSHYAAYPIQLPRRLIESMCPREVCVVCGEARRRITGRTDAYAAARAATGDMTKHQTGDRLGVGLVGTSRSAQLGSITCATYTTLGWSDCGHDNYRPGIVLDPFAGSGTTGVAAAQCGRDAVLIDLDARNVDLCRRRLAETMLIVDETTVGDVTTWTVRHDMPGTKHEHPDQLSLFAG